jgi:hypothetical protein
MTEDGLPLLDVSEVTQVTLKRTHQVVTVAPFGKSPFIASQRLIKALIVLWRPNREWAAHQNAVAFSAPSDLACLPISSFGGKVCEEDAL